MVLGYQLRLDADGAGRMGQIPAALPGAGTFVRERALGADRTRRARPSDPASNLYAATGAAFSTRSKAQV